MTTIGVVACGLLMVGVCWGAVVVAFDITSKRRRAREAEARVALRRRAKACERPVR